MNESKSLKKLTEKMSKDLYYAMNLIDILEDIIEGVGKEGFLISAIKKMYITFLRIMKFVGI